MSVPRLPPNREYHAGLRAEQAAALCTTGSLITRETRSVHMPVNNHFHQSHFSCVLLDGAFCRCDKGIFIILHFYNTFNNIINTANETPRQTLRNYVEYLTIYLHMRQTLPSPCEFVYDIGTHSATVNQHPTSICTSHNSTAHLGSIFPDNSLH